jgi:hypothetical protein
MLPLGFKRLKTNYMHLLTYIYIKMFNYSPECSEPITGSSSGMSGIKITHTIQQYKYNFYTYKYTYKYNCLKYNC